MFHILKSEVLLYVVEIQIHDAVESISSDNVARRITYGSLKLLLICVKHYGRMQSVYVIRHYRTWSVSII